MSRSTYCDRCGKKEKMEEGFRTFEYNDEGCKKTLDICDKCFMEFKIWLD